MASVPALMLFISLMLFSDKKTLKLVEGGIYSIKNSKGQFGMMKILKIEDQIMHSLVFRQLFDSRPKKVEYSALSSKPRYIRIDRKMISKWYAKLLGTTGVDSNEISQYIK